MAFRRLPGVCSQLRVALAETFQQGLPGDKHAYSQLALVNKGVAAGPGGRSSISGVTATVFGCSGFLGRYVVQALAKAGSQMVLPFRCDELDVQHLKPMGDLGQIVFYPDFDIHDDALLRHAISKSNVVINLVGAARETWNFGYEEVHVDFPRRLAAAAAETGSVERFMHVTCINAGPDAPSRRLQTKAQGDALVRELLPHSTLFRAAPIVGPEDRLTNEYAASGKRGPLVPLVDGGAARIQPVYVSDVAAAMVATLSTYDARGADYWLAGPEVMTWKEFAQVVFDTMREPFNPLPVPASIATALGRPWDWLQKRTPPLPIPKLYFSEFAAEQAADAVLPSDPSLLTFESLGIKPMSCVEGSPIEHIRHLRAGGYDFGTTAGTASTGGAGVSG